MDLPFGGVLVQETQAPDTSQIQVVELTAAALQALDQSHVESDSGGASLLDGSSCAVSWVLVIDSGEVPDRSPSSSCPRDDNQDWVLVRD